MAKFRVLGGALRGGVPGDRGQAEGLRRRRSMKWGDLLRTEWWMEKPAREWTLAIICFSLGVVAALVARG